MDNLTHSLIGVAIARTALGLRGKQKGESSALLDRLTVLTSVVASNLPDGDAILPKIFPHLDPRLIYLTHHRGYTHTALLMIPMAAIALSLVRLMTIRSDRGGSEFKGSWRFLASVAFVALLAHVGADSWNDYGVHPFSPFWNQWFYGGFIFIIEPLIWFALLAWLVWCGRTRIGRNTGWTLLAVAGLLLWSNPMTSQTVWPVALIASLWAGLHLIAQRKLKSLILAWTSVAAVLAAFFAGREAVRARFANEDWTDISSTPAPANPLCWRVILVRAMENSYRARVGVVSLAPSFVDPASCYARGSVKGLAPLEPVESNDSASYWKGEFSAPLSELLTLAQKDCRANRQLGFLRVPYWFQKKDGSTVLGDLRYDQAGGGFTEMEFDGKPFNDCPNWGYPHWDWPVSRNPRKS